MFCGIEAYLTAHFDKRINILRYDNGGKYKSGELVTFYQKKGIMLQYTTQYSPSLNGVAGGQIELQWKEQKPCYWIQNYQKYFGRRQFM